MIVVIQYNILKIFTTSVQLIICILYFIVVLMNERNLHKILWIIQVVPELPYFQGKL